MMSNLTIGGCDNIKPLDTYNKNEKYLVNNNSNKFSHINLFVDQDLITDISFQFVGSTKF